MRTDRYFCSWPECGQSYGKPSKLAEHMRSHTNDRCFICDFEGCEKSFLRKGHLQRHQLSAHLKSRPFQCSRDGCTSSFALKHHLIRHERSHDKSLPFECTWPGCPAAFPKHEQLRLHICKDHTGEHLFRCETCNTNFESKSEFKRHERCHTTREYVCGVEGCGQTFSKWSQVVLHRKCDHRKSGGGDCNLSCEECGRGPFKSEIALRQHCKIHWTTTLESVNHSCPQCNKQFSSRSSLKAHGQAVHSTELPFVCDDCGKSYGYKKLLKRHQERVHSVETVAIVDGTDGVKERSLVCSLEGCQRRFFRQYDLDRHLQSMHNNVDSSDSLNKFN